MRDLIHLIANALVDSPEKVIVNEVNSIHHSVFELKVAKADLGKIIGKQGKTAHAIRTILSAASGKEKKRMTLEIVE